MIKVQIIIFSLDNSEISLLLVINNYQIVNIQHKSTLYNDFIKQLKKEHFPELVRGNRLILTQGWNPVIQKSIHSTIAETLSHTVPHFNVCKLNTFLLEMVHRQNELQEANKQYVDEISNDKWKIKYQELIKQYNQRGEENQTLYQKWQNDKEQIKKAYKELQINYSFLSEQIEVLRQIKNQLYLENLDLKNKIMQLEKQLQQISISQITNISNPKQIQMKQQCSDQSYQSNNPKIRIFPNSNDTSQQEISENSHSSKSTNKHNFESGSQPFNCSYCKNDCPEYIELPCLQRYHKYCFEELGRKSYIDQQPTAKCICSKKISTKLFTKETQFLLLSHQAALIYGNYRQQYYLERCKDCEFFYRFDQPSDDGSPYCPNCLKFITES